MAARTFMRLRFPRRARIKTGRDFARTRQQGERLVQGCIIANWRTLPPGQAPRLGVVVSGKVGKAVVRSRVKRLLREAYRLHQFELASPLDLVLVARPSIAGKAFATVERDLLAVWKRARLASIAPA